MIKKYYITILITILICCVFTFLGSIVFKWEEWLIWLLTLAPIVLYTVIYCIIYMLMRQKIAKLFSVKQYSKVLELSKTMSEWYYGGKDNSMYHMLASSAYFHLGDDHNFLNECNHVTDPKYQADKNFYLAVYNIINGNLVAAEQQANLLKDSRVYGNHSAQISQLQLLLDIANCDDDNLKGDLIKKGLQQFKSDRIINYLNSCIVVE